MPKNPLGLTNPKQRTMAVLIKSLKISNDGPRLMATPNVTEWDAIQADIDKFQHTKKELMGEGPLQVVTSHRGSVLYLENGAIVNRWEGESVNGYMCGSTKPEKCRVMYNGLQFDAVMEFI